MSISRSAFVSMMVAVAAVALTSRAASAPRAQEASPGDKFAWAEACKSCHEEIYESWAKTKHARTIDRLSSSEQQQECVVCHTTGGIAKIEKDGKWVNRNVQCEACHGAGAAHAADPTNKVGLSKVPGARPCETCHNSKSPHFRGFVYQGMARLSHAIPTKK